MLAIDNGSVCFRLNNSPVRVRIDLDTFSGLMMHETELPHGELKGHGD